MAKTNRTRSIAKVAPHRIAHYFAQLIERLALRLDVMFQSNGSIAGVHHAFGHGNDHLPHARTLPRSFLSASASLAPFKGF